MIAGEEERNGLKKQRSSEDGELLVVELVVRRSQPRTSSRLHNSTHPERTEWFMGHRQRRKSVMPGSDRFGTQGLSSKDLFQG